jgi:hypothetical protein
VHILRVCKGDLSGILGGAAFEWVVCHSRIIRTLYRNKHIACISALGEGRTTPKRDDLVEFLIKGGPGRGARKEFAMGKVNEETVSIEHTTICTYNSIHIIYETPSVDRYFELYAICNFFDKGLGMHLSTVVSVCIQDDFQHASHVF